MLAPSEPDESGDLFDSGGSQLSDQAAEMQLIGIVLNQPSTLAEAMASISAVDLFDPWHRRIFDAMCASFEAGEHISIERLIDSLGIDLNAIVGNGITMGGYLAQLVAQADLNLNVDEIAEHLAECAERRAVGAADDLYEPFISKLGGMRWSEIGSAGAPQYAWVVENIIPVGEPILIFGDSGTGKSFSTFYMALCIARGEKFYGANVEQGLVIYVAAEGGKGFTKRKTAYCNYYNVGDAEVPFYLITKKPDFFSSDDGVNLLIAEITAICRLYRVPLRMIVLDTLSALTPGMNENASADVSRVRARLQKVVDAFGVATAFVHHTAKGGTTPRGHGSLTADFETTIHFTTTDIKNVDGLPVHRATGGKQREEAKGKSWEFVLPVVTVGTNKWGNPETSCVAVPYLKTRNASVKSWNPNPTEKVFLEALFEALNTKSVPTPASLALPEEITRVAEIEDVRSFMRERYVPVDEESTKADNRFRQAFKRAGDKLKAGKVIGFKNPYFWYAGKPIVGMASNPVT